MPTEDIKLLSVFELYVASKLLICTLHIFGCKALHSRHNKFWDITLGKSSFAYAHCNNITKI